jgi:mannose-6-phosphate isomerase-like protein (cupin superfamily)
MHHFGTFDDGALAPHDGYAGRGDGYRQAALIGPHTGSVHTGLSLAQLDAGGVLAPHVHSFEEGFYILEGKAILAVGDTGVQLQAGDYGALKVGTVHGWRNTGSGRLRWLQMQAPQPKPARAERDTFFPKGATVPTTAAARGETAPQSLAQGGAILGHFEASDIPPVAQRQNVLKGLEGVFLKWLIDENVGAAHHRLLFIEYQPGVGIGLHDHTFEEGYFILSGEVEATMDGKVYRAGPGNVLWTGVGCVHAFRNVSAAPVLWLETFAPQPPKENAFRFMAEWETKARELEG